MRETILLILAVLIGAANAEFSLEIQLKSLKVDGTLSTGAKCSAFSALGFDCSPRPKICIELIPYVTEDFADCYSGSFIDLGVFSNTNEITFDATGTYSGWQNPSVYSLNSDYQGFQVKLVVYNAEGVYYNLIDKKSFNFTSESADNAEQGGGKIESFKLSYALRSAGTAVPTTTLNTISTTTNAGVTTTTVTGTGSTVITTTTVGGSTTTVTGGTSISTTTTPLASTTTNLASSTTTTPFTTTTTPSGGGGF